MRKYFVTSRHPFIQTESTTSACLHTQRSAIPVGWDLEKSFFVLCCKKKRNYMMRNGGIVVICTNCRMRTPTTMTMKFESVCNKWRKMPTKSVRCCYLICSILCGMTFYCVMCRTSIPRGTENNRTFSTTKTNSLYLCLLINLYGNLEISGHCICILSSKNNLYRKGFLFVLFAFCFFFLSFFALN